MFGISFPELTIIMVVALIVIGPEKLPEVVRTVGKLVGKFRYFSDNLRSDLEKEFKIDELKQSIYNDNQLKQIKKELTDVAKETESAVRSLETSMRSNIEETKALVGSLYENEHIARSEVAADEEALFDDYEVLDDDFSDYYNTDEEITKPPKNYHQKIMSAPSLPAEDLVDQYRQIVLERQLLLNHPFEKTPAMLVYELQQQQKKRHYLSEHQRKTLYTQRLLEINHS